MGEDNKTFFEILKVQNSKSVSSFYVQFRDVSTGATGATAVAPKF